MKFLLVVFILCLYYLVLYYGSIRPAQRQLRRLNAELAVLNRVSLAFHRSYGLPDAFGAILSELLAAGEAEAASLFLFDPGRKVYRLAVSVGPLADRVANLEVPLGEGLVSKAVHEKRTLVCDDVKAEVAHYGAIDASSGFTTRSLVCVPLIAEDGPIGAFELINKKGASKFDAQDVRLLETLAAVAALAVRNATQLKKA